MNISRRILSLYLPRLAAERVIRRQGINGPLAVIGEQHNAQIITALNGTAEAEGLYLGQSLSDARAVLETLITHPANPQEEARFLGFIARWAGQFSPWIAVHPPGDLFLDITGCAHLFGGEAALMERMQDALEQLGLSAQIGIADTPGAAWALARFSGVQTGPRRNGDAIDQEAYATRSRASKRRGWEKGGAAPIRALPGAAPAIAPVGQIMQAIGPLPLAALRLEPEITLKLNRLGLNAIADLANLPRASVGRRFGASTLRRLDQAMGTEPEPITPTKPLKHFATRISFPDPIGLRGDIEAGVRRLCAPLCDKLRLASLGARKLALTLYRSDHSLQMVEVSLARPSHDPARILPLFELHLPQIEPRFGIDMMRLEALTSEPIHPEQSASPSVTTKTRAHQDGYTDLIGRLGVRLGLEAVVVLEPGESHLPEKASMPLVAAFAGERQHWPNPRGPRPLVVPRPERIEAHDGFRPPQSFRWRKRNYLVAGYQGPERITPEWWLDLDGWRDGIRDYWSVISDCGSRLWLYHSHGGDLNGGWHCAGIFD